MDDTLVALLDASCPVEFVGAYLDDRANGLPWSELPPCLALLMERWISWRKRHVLPLHVLAALTVLCRRFSGNVGAVDADGFYRQFSPSPVFTLRSDAEETVDEAATARDVVEETPAPPSPVSISAATERAFFEVSMNDFGNGGISPLNGDESPPHKRYKKWYTHEVWVDPAVAVRAPDRPDPLRPVTTGWTQGPAAGPPSVPSAPGSGSDMVTELTAQAVPIWHRGQERYRWGGCRNCAHLSLQPHLNKTGRVGPGLLSLRCSSWFRTKQCWYSYPFPMGLFSLLPQQMQVDYASLEQCFRRGAQANA